MSLHLDARQRAMLQEMGVHVWSPRPAPVAVPASAARPPHSPPQTPLKPQTPPAPQTARPAASRAAPSPVPTARIAPAPVVTAPGAPLAWALHAPQPAYPHAAPAMSTEASPRWLLVAEGAAGADPLTGEAGVLLDNMLRALHLRQQPQVFICLLAPLAAEATGAAPETQSQALAQAIAEVQPAVLLVMGRAAARSVLGRSEPLGQLRSQSHRIAGVPAVVTYDAAYLLRAPSAKANAWDDLCRARALALAPPGSAGPVNS